jgi:hypothetical protein
VGLNLALLVAFAVSAVVLVGVSLAGATPQRATELEASVSEARG